MAYRKYQRLKKQLAFAGTKQGPEQKEGSDGQLVEGDRPEQFEGVGRGFRETSSGCIYYENTSSILLLIFIKLNSFLIGLSLGNFCLMITAQWA